MPEIDSFWLRIGATVLGAAIIAVGGFLFGHTQIDGHPVTLKRMEYIERDHMEFRQNDREVNQKLEQVLDEVRDLRRQGIDPDLQRRLENQIRRLEEAIQRAG